MIQPFEPLAEEGHDVLAEEGERLLRFVAEPEADDKIEVRFDE